MKFFDPACGCGNFLIIAYRELRELEIELIRELHRDGADKTQRVLDTADLSRINVNQFYGIEIGEFPARIAETALWMMDHIMNNRLSLEFGQSHVRIPLEDAPHILNGDALEVDWARFSTAGRRAPSYTAIHRSSERSSRANSSALKCAVSLPWARAVEHSIM